MRKNQLLFFIIFIFEILFLSCSNSSEGKAVEINLKDNFYWAPATKEGSIAETENLRFQKFITEGNNNIKKSAGRKQEYVWLMAAFSLPENLKNKALALLITHLHFADKVWINDTFIGSSGDFPPNEKSTMWSSHFYPIQESVLNKDGKNIILIKVYCQGRAEISNKILLGEYDSIKSKNTFRTFIQSAIYLFAEGGMFFTAVLFFLIYMWRKKEKEYLSFALLCVSSMIFTTPFFISLLPLSYPLNISFLLFYKLTICQGFYLIALCLSSLTIRFIKKKESKFNFFVRLFIFLFSTIITLAAPTYSSLMRLSPVMIALSVLQVVQSYIFILKTKLSQKERNNFFILNSAFIPLVLAVLLDFLIKGYFQKVDTPYITLFGWLFTLTGFLVLLSVRYNKAVSENEYQNIKLKREVLRQTRELYRKNNNLEEQIRRAETDLEMASVVQKKFFPYPPKSLKGWDIAVSYSPLDKVSGDMYDFYLDGNDLKGFSLFDVSGHGVAASLITMLAKNIVFQSFMRNMENKETVSRTLYEINDEIIETKGEIENYLTGLMFRFSPFDEKDECSVEMANAGHPNPILYSAKNNSCKEIESGNSEEHHGAIGLNFITVSFPQIIFNMAEDDILVFYTDGITEGRNKKNEMFGKERLKEIIQSSYAKDAQSILEDIIDSFKDFTKNVKRDDDITIVVMKRDNSDNFIEDLIEL